MTFFLNIEFSSSQLASDFTVSYLVRVQPSDVERVCAVSLTVRPRSHTALIHTRQGCFGTKSVTLCEELRVPEKGQLKS